MTESNSYLAHMTFAWLTFDAFKVNITRHYTEPEEAYARYLTRKFDSFYDRICPMKKRSTKPENDFGGYEMIEFYLDSDQEANFSSKIQSSIDPTFDDVASMLIAGYKVSVTYLPDKDSYIVSWTCKNELDPNYKRVLSSWADTISIAWWLNVFKHTECCENGDWNEFAVSKRTFG